jgi:hypothetical protein
MLKSKCKFSFFWCENSQIGPLIKIWNNSSGSGFNLAHKVLNLTKLGSNTVIKEVLYLVYLLIFDFAALLSNDFISRFLSEQEKGESSKSSSSQ